MYAYLIHSERGIMDKPKTIRMPKWLDRAMHELAKDSDRSFSKEAVRAMKEYVLSKGIKCPE